MECHEKIAKEYNVWKMIKTDEIQKQAYYLVKPNKHGVDIRREKKSTPFDVFPISEECLFEKELRK